MRIPRRNHFIPTLYAPPFLRPDPYVVWIPPFPHKLKEALGTYLDAGSVEAARHRRWRRTSCGSAAAAAEIAGGGAGGETAGSSTEGTAAGDTAGNAAVTVSVAAAVATIVGAVAAAPGAGASAAVGVEVDAVAFAR